MILKRAAGIFIANPFSDSNARSAADKLAAAEGL
jgi:hypothetical protein